MTKRPLLTVVSFFKENESRNRRERKNPVSRIGNNPIYPLLSPWISTWTEPEALFFSILIFFF
jgi:hypothetical protein